MLSYLFKQKLLFLGLVFWAVFLGIMPNLSQAALVESKGGLPGQYEIDLAKIKAFLEKEIVERRLVDSKINKEELLKRIEKLDPDELHELALRTDKIKIGGNPGGAWLIVLLVGLIIIAILYFTNYTIKIEPRDTVPRRY